MASAERIRKAAAALDNVAPELNKNAKQILLGQALAESQYGDAENFATPTGVPSYNWGAIYAPGDLGTIPVKDTADGKSFTAKAAWNSSDEAGARQLYNLIKNNYGEALAVASKGDVYGYAKALFRDNRMPYYGGFPPGNPNALAPKDVPLHSPLDHYWRTIAYKRMVAGGAGAVASALGQSIDLDLIEPKPPSSGGKGGPWIWVGVGTLSVAIAVGAYGWSDGWFD